MVERNGSGGGCGRCSVLVNKLILRILLLCSLAARAATYTWDGGGSSNNWNDAANWSNNVLAVSSADTTIAFGSGPRNTPSQNIAHPFLLNTLSFGNMGGSYTLSGSPLDFHASGAVFPTISQNNIFAVEIDNPLTLTDTLTYAGGGSGTITLAGKLGGAGGLYKNDGNGILALSGGTAASPSSIPFLGVNAGAAKLTNGGHLNLSATGSTGFSGNSS